MAFLDKTGLQTLTNKLVQGDAIKVASHRGRTVENVIDNITRECGNVPTPLEYKIENRVADFRVGQGRDVDASGDVEKGYSEIELQGKTWQNLININKSSIADKNTVEIRDNSVIFLEGANIDSFVDFNIKELLKPNVQYTVMLDVRGCNGADNQVFQCGITDGHSWYPFLPRITSNGRYSVSFKPVLPETSLNALFRIRHNSGSEVSTEERVLSNIIILEGDHTQTPVEELPQYFEGIKSSFEDGVVDIDMVGKNLFDKTNCARKAIANSSTGADFKLNDSQIRCTTTIPINTKSNVIYSTPSIVKYQYLICEVDEGKVVATSGWQQSKFSKIYNSSELYVTFRKADSSTITDEELNEILNIGFQLEKSPISTPYQPYYKKKISFNIDEPLRSLPNGVSDEIRNNNGQWELVRRVCKTIINGSIGASGGYSGEDFQELYILPNTVEPPAKNSGSSLYANNGLCDVLPTHQEASSEWGFPNGLGGISVRKKKEALPQPSFEGIKEWLSKNPVVIYYELETPIITPIEPIKFETQPLGSITINSEISPTSFHTVQLNRAAQIERGITEIAELKNRVEILETMYDSHFLETAHKLELLGMDYEFESEEI